MSPYLWLIALLLWIVPAQGNEITLTLTDDEQRMLLQMLDQATRGSGLQAAETAVYFGHKIQAAVQAAKQSPAADKPDKK